jgi:hypothetical protein
MLCRRRLSVGRSCLAPGEYAVYCLYGVALLSGLAGHEPAFVGLGPAVLAWAGVVSVDPSAIADYVAAVALGFAAVCV